MIELPNIDPFRQRYNELESKLADPSVFKDQELATKISREHSKIKVILEQFKEISICQKAIEDAKELINEPEFAETAKDEIEELEIKIPSLHKTLLYSMLPEDPDLGRNTIIEIRAGAGGGEASLFASDLYRMYCKLAENKNWNFECMSQSTSETGGFKEVIFSVNGNDIYSKRK